MWRGCFVPIQCTWVLSVHEILIRCESCVCENDRLTKMTWKMAHFHRLIFSNFIFKYINKFISNRHIYIDNTRNWYIFFMYATQRHKLLVFRRANCVMGVDDLDLRNSFYHCRRLTVELAVSTRFDPKSGKIRVNNRENRRIFGSTVVRDEPILRGRCPLRDFRKNKNKNGFFHLVNKYWSKRNRLIYKCDFVFIEPIDFENLIDILCR